MKYNETIITRADWNKIYACQYLNSDGSPNLNKIKTSLYLYHVLLNKVEEVYSELSLGEITDPQTAPELILGFLEDEEENLIKFVEEEAIMETRKMLGTFGSN